jgi:hypothetical protein
MTARIADCAEDQPVGLLASGIVVSEDVLRAAERLGVAAQLPRVVELSQELFGSAVTLRVTEDPELADWTHIAGGGASRAPTADRTQGRQEAEPEVEKASAKGSPQMTAAKSTEPEKLDLRSHDVRADKIADLAQRETRTMKTSLIALSIALTVAVFDPSCAISAENGKQPARSSIPYVATRNDAVQNMLWMADVGKDDVLYDLGSGDGRIAISAVRDFGARRAVGIEIDPKLVRESRENVRKAKMADRAEIIQGDLFTTDIHEASVVTLFLGHEPNLKLRPKLFSVLKPGTRIVSHQFGMGEWQADKTLTVRTVYLGMYSSPWNPFVDNPRVPDYAGDENRHGTSDKITMWVLPAPVAGVWRGRLETAQGPQDCQLTLHQRLSEVSGTLQVPGQANLSGKITADLWSGNLRYGYHIGQIRFDGHVKQDAMQGSLANGQLQERAWGAKRDKADLTGTWEWPCLSGSRSVRLRIERRDNHLIATYLDRDDSVPVADFYDCGGGFYFTLLIGRTRENGLRITEDTGWLIGEGVLDHGKLKGTIEFYPWSTMPGVPGGKKASPRVIQSWAPRLIKL